MAPASLLHAALKNPFIRAYSVDERRALFNRVRNGLLEIDVFTGGKSGNSHRNMPVVGRADEHRVQLLIKNFAKVAVRCRQPFRSFLNGIAPWAVDVADRDNLIGIVAGPVGGVEQIVHATAGADDADAQRIVRTKHASGG